MLTCEIRENKNNFLRQPASAIVETRILENKTALQLILIGSTLSRSITAKILQVYVVSKTSSVLIYERFGSDCLGRLRIEPQIPDTSSEESVS